MRSGPRPGAGELPLRLTAVVLTKDGGLLFTHLARHLAWQRAR